VEIDFGSKRGERHGRICKAHSRGEASDSKAGNPESSYFDYDKSGARITITFKNPTPKGNSKQ